MYFEALENFEWLNDPENVRFEEDSMTIYAKSGTDFWQSIQHGFKKDDGHFFFCRQNRDFVLTLKWKTFQFEKFSQCGIMLRVDEKNWFKSSLMDEKNGLCFISSYTINGHSDWAGLSLEEQRISEIWFRLQRVNNDYILSYSLDGEQFTKSRMFYMPDFGEVKVGAYIANPSGRSFAAELSSIKID